MVSRIPFASVIAVHSSGYGSAGSSRIGLRLGLPSGEQAWERVAAVDDRFAEVVVDLAKLTDYVLSDSHRLGRHKARVFRARLGLGPGDAKQLREALLLAALADDARFRHTDQDAYGVRFVLDFPIAAVSGPVLVRSAWIVPDGERVLRFVTCYVL
jgi:hypothetical protein